jgi:hypothetical protein
MNKEGHKAHMEINVQTKIRSKTQRGETTLGNIVQNSLVQKESRQFFASPIKFVSLVRIFFFPPQEANFGE